MASLNHPPGPPVTLGNMREAWVQRNLPKRLRWE